VNLKTFFTTATNYNVYQTVRFKMYKNLITLLNKKVNILYVIKCIIKTPKVLLIRRYQNFKNVLVGK